jgi:hypothetical protein
MKRAVAGGVVSTLFMAIGTFVLGEVSGYQARELLSSSLSGINMLCNTVILGRFHHSCLNAYFAEFEPGGRVSFKQNSLPACARHSKGRYYSYHSMPLSRLCY